MTDAPSEPGRSTRVTMRLIGVGALLVGALFVRQCFDLVADWRVAGLRQGDIINALGSIALLAMVALAFIWASRKARG